MHAFLTACTQRKRFTPSPFLCARNLTGGAFQDVLDAWKGRLAEVESSSRAKDLYCGRSFAEARKAAQIAKADLHIVSAGLGLIHFEQPVPSYDLTVSKGSPDYILGKLNDDKTESDWWSALGGAKALHEVFDRTECLIIIALPSPYLRMIAPFLSELPESTCKRIRIVGGRDARGLRPILESARLPYDDRLDGPQSFLRGTKSDFASRALRHFAEVVLSKAPLETAETHAKQVELALAAWRPPVTKVGVRVSDTDLKSVLREHWYRAGGRTTKLLRLLRDEMNIACEQKRFARLAAEVREERTLS
ncbi:hypothetical protein AMK05_CH00787 [Rhizobium sp. N324]|uniref:DUF6884 domain-containing protein n=1 Tax=Rhizobium sp. N4311 TaxID=1703972 RepID=UPI0007E9408C|nr:hypothetical protein AMK05_CH00787 [Rhizobium sp. N324]OYD02784.1 hypothetical protein AMK08_CH100783 [Rhizobium sp. N4311]